MAWAKEKAEETRNPRKSLKDEMREKLFDNPIELPEDIPSCVMIAGSDGTGKTGLALGVLTQEDIDAGKKLVFIDLDEGGLPLLLQYHREAVNSGNIIYYDPVIWSTNPRTNAPYLDYDATINSVNAIAIAVKEEAEENGNIKGIILDGLSKLLKWSEYLMRLEKEIDIAGGVDMRYWQLRNKLFLETLELYKSLPMDKYLIFHQDFLPEIDADKKLSQVKINANQMIFQRIVCEKIDKGNVVEFVGTITKSKFDLAREGEKTAFAVLQKDTGKYTWEPEKVIEKLRPERKMEK